jgi:hypothetical protein
MFDTGRAAMKSNGKTVAVVLAIALVILLCATWYFARR